MEWLVVSRKAELSWRAAGASGSCGCKRRHDELLEAATRSATVALCAHGPDDSTDDVS